MWKELRSVGDTFLKTDFENLGDAGYQNKKRYYLERRTMDGALCWGTIYNVQRMVTVSYTHLENEKKEVRDCQMYFTVPTDMFSMWIKKFIRLRKNNKSSI